MKIPENLKWIQANTGSRLGNLYTSKGIDLVSDIGNLRTAPRLLINTNSQTDADLGMPVAFRYYNSQWWAICDTVLFKQASADGSASATFSQDAISGTPTDCSKDASDMEIFNGNLYVTRAGTTAVSYFNTSAWSSFAAATGTAASRLMCVFGDRMYMTYNVFNIASWNTSNAVATAGSSYALTLAGKQLNITFIRPSSTGIWIGTLNTNNGKGSIFFWNGQQTTPNAEYGLNSIGVLSGYVDNDILYAIDTDGALLQFNGGGFVKVSKLPVPKDNYLFSPIDEDNADRFIHPNGLTAKDGVVQVLVNGRVFNADQTTLENFPSGIWEWTKETGFYHKGSPSYTSVGSTSITDYGQIRIRGVGALVDAKSIGQNESEGTLLAGVSYHPDGTTATSYAIFTDDSLETTQKYSEIILPEITAGSYTDMWQKIVPRFKRLAGATDSIVVKHRVGMTEPVQISMTWTSTSTFTTATDVSDMVGYEVRVLSGKGAGKSAHITSVTGSYTVTLDDTFDGASGTAVAHVTEWIKDGSYSGTSDYFTEFTLSEPSTVIQPKICLQTTGKWNLYDLFIINSGDKKAV